MLGLALWQVLRKTLEIRAGNGVEQLNEPPPAQPMWAKAVKTLIPAETKTMGWVLWLSGRLRGEPAVSPVLWNQMPTGSTFKKLKAQNLAYQGG